MIVIIGGVAIISVAIVGEVAFFIIIIDLAVVIIHLIIRVNCYDEETNRSFTRVTFI